MTTRNGIILIALCLIGLGESQAQWVTQEFNLEDGWNAIYLNVQPEPADCGTVVGNEGNLVSEIMTYNDSFNPVQFIQDVSEANANNLNSSAWLRWGSGSGTQITNVVPSLSSIIAGRAYLVYATSNGLWRIQGKPTMKEVGWRANSLNLVGFQVDTNSPPSFSTFFADCDEVVLSKVYRMGVSGSWDNISPTNSVQSGEAFWIQTTNGIPDFNGPVSISTGSRHGLDYGKTVMELPLQVTVKGAGNVQLTLTPETAEENPLDAEHAAYAGDAPLMWWNPDAAENGFGQWEELTNGVSITVSGTNSTTLRIAAARRSLTNQTASATLDPVYTRLLHVTDGTNLSMRVPVHVVGNVSPPALNDLPVGSAGLWVGNVVINEVNQPYPTGNPGTYPVAAGSEYSFRVLLHCSSNGVVRLLSHAVLAWKDGEYGSPGANGYREVITNGYYRIIGNDDLLGTIADPSTARRFSSANFSHQAPLESANSTANSLGFLVSVHQNDPRSPYRHAYHPKHDGSGAEALSGISTNINMENQWGETWSTQHVASVSDETFSIIRSIDMSFSPANADASSEWGVTRLGGEWKEIITGLHNTSLEVKGGFILNHVSNGELEL